ncbi:long-chain-fatty-acid--coa ligase [Holotrichia oblita]|uniref:Long-chain-fatty-acid--coa ligase n=1 Tax=Holotrichia oblita TaxID=644536 RepID=A0ACB9SUB9_HOLOL|nr:long-chain-fatty-acid--coa ligase [Holotrichia oblita]
MSGKKRTNGNPKLSGLNPKYFVSEGKEENLSRLVFLGGETQKNILGSNGIKNTDADTNAESNRTTQIVLADVEEPNQGDNIIRTKNPDITPNPAGFGHELYTRMKEYGDSEAQVDAETGKSETFKELLQRCVRVALQLKKRGVTSEDVVAPATGNHLNTAVAVVAPLLIGAKVACIDGSSTPADILSMINVVKPKVILGCKEYEDKLEAAIKDGNSETELVIFGETETNTQFEDLLKPISQDEEDHFEPYETNDLNNTAVIIFSSGSTGAPKGICMSHYSILCQIGSYVQFKKAQPVGYTILFSGIHWVTGQMILGSSLLAGHPRLICDKFTEEKCWRYLVKYNVMSLFMIAPHAIALMKYGNPNKCETPNLRVIAIFGAKASQKNMAALRAHFYNPVLTMNLYGVSEVFGLVFSYKDISAFMKKPETVGLPARGFQYKIVNPETGKICGPNETGELHLKSKFYMTGYHNQDSSMHFDQDGFFKTGDMGYYDEDHCFFLIDRVKETFKYCNYWVSPTLLESILLEHPAVKEACVIGIPCDVGAIATAVVTKSNSSEDVDEQELVKFVNERVGETSKLRGGIIFVEEGGIPYTSTGKVRRFMLRNQIMDDLEELPDQGDNIIRTKDLEVQVNSKGLGHEIFAQMKKHADAVAQIWAACEESDTFELLLERSVRLALHLQQRGVTSKDILSPCATNDLNAIVTMVAPLLLGAKIACMDPCLGENDIGEMLQLTKSKVIFIYKEHEEKFGKIVDDLNLEVEIVVFGETRKHTPFKEFLKPFPKDDEQNFVPFDVRNLNDDALIVFSGGLSGVPKGMCFSHECVLSQLKRLAGTGRKSTNFILYSSLAWTSTQLTILTSLISGSCRLIASEFDPAQTWKYLLKYDIKNLILPPNYALQFLRYGNPDNIEIPNLKLFNITGGKLNLDQINGLHALFTHPVLIISPYKLSEVYGPIFSYDNVDVLKKKPGSSGSPIAGFEYKIVNPVTGTICGPNEKGELCLKSKYCISGYYNNDATSNIFDEDGFFKTGDVAYYDDDHYFYIVDAINDIFRYESIEIPSSLLESILYEHPSVKIAAIIAIHSGDEDIAMAVVVKHDSESANDVTEQDLIDFFNDKVNNLHKIRGGILFVKESVIPYTVTGRIRKFLLCKTMLEDLDGVDLSINIM